jgi:hypothetical protein
MWNEKRTDEKMDQLVIISSLYALCAKIPIEIGSLSLSNNRVVMRFTLP